MYKAICTFLMVITFVETECEMTVECIDDHCYVPKCKKGKLVYNQCTNCPDASADADAAESAKHEVLESYLKGSSGSPVEDSTNPPENKNSSIQYILYKRSDPITPCYMEPNSDSIQRCSFDSDLPTVFEIHGYTVDLGPGNILDVLKNAILEKEDANVIIVNWTLYNKPPYSVVVKNAYKVGSKVAEFIECLKKHTGLKSEQVHLVGHSLGAHMSGHIGRISPGIGRISGLDPAGAAFYNQVGRLNYEDANFVLVLHTSSYEDDCALGIHQPLGHMDFYPNGGKSQPFCRFGSSFLNFAGKRVLIDSTINWMICNHDMSIKYFIQSINNTGCQFFGVLCRSYADFECRNCPPGSSIIGDMGFYSQKIKDLPPMSKFYLKTNGYSPFCNEEGFKP